MTVKFLALNGTFVSLYPRAQKCYRRRGRNRCKSQMMESSVVNAVLWVCQSHCIHKLTAALLLWPGMHQDSRVNGEGLGGTRPPQGTTGTSPCWETGVIFFTDVPTLTLPLLRELTQIHNPPRWPHWDFFSSPIWVNMSLCKKVYAHYKRCDFRRKEPQLGSSERAASTFSYKEVLKQSSPPTSETLALGTGGEGRAGDGLPSFPPTDGHGRLEEVDISESGPLAHLRLVPLSDGALLPVV